MKCPNCGAELSDNPCPKFCNYCGVPITEPQAEPETEPFYQEMPAPETQVLHEEPEPIFNPVNQIPDPPYMPPVQPEKKKKKKGHGGFIAAIIILAVFVAAFATFGVLAFLEIREDRANIEDLKADISDREAEIESVQDAANEENKSLRAEINDYEDDIADLHDQLDEKDNIIYELQENVDEMSSATEDLEPIMQQYNDVFNYSEDCGFGWSSENFHATGSIALLSLSENPTLDFNLLFSLETDRAITVRWEKSNDCINIACNSENIIAETPFTITAVEKGIAIVQFTNDYNDEAFNIMVVVTD